MRSLIVIGSIVFLAALPTFIILDVPWPYAAVPAIILAGVVRLATQEDR